MKQTMKKWGVALLAVLLMFSLFSVSVFADDTAESKKLATGEIVEIIVGGVIVVALVVLGILKRDKVVKFFREYKSELKRIVWYPWKDTKKGTVIVLVALVICAVVICLVDFGLRQGITAIVNLFNK